METQNESVEVDEGIEEFVPCVVCGSYNKVDAECACCIEEREHNIQKESAERLRYLMSLGHPGESGEPYNRWQTMEECIRRGKQLFLDLGWPTDPNSVYKNKYTGDEHTLNYELRNLVMERDRDKPFDEMFSIHGWAVIEHAWPKEFWNDSEMFDEYKGKLSYFKDSDDGDVEDLVDEDDAELEFQTIYDTRKEPKKKVDKSQTGLGGWF